MKKIKNAIDTAVIRAKVAAMQAMKGESAFIAVFIIAIAVIVAGVVYRDELKTLITTLSTRLSTEAQNLFN